MKWLLLLICMVVALVGIEAKGLRSIEPMYNAKGLNDCTAFSINDIQHLWLSALHCWEDGELVAKMPAKVVRASVMQDLVMMQTGRGARALRLADHEPRVGDQVHVSGFPLGNDAELTPYGFVSATAYPFKQVGGLFLATTIPVCGGHSGSPMLDKHNDVVSVAQVTAGAPEAPCGWFAFGPTYEALKAFVGDAWEH